MSCKCNGLGCSSILSLGSFSQCDPVEVEVRTWKPTYYSRSLYEADIASEEHGVEIPFVEVADRLDDLSHQEALDVLAEKEKSSAKSGTMKFWLAAGLAALILK